MDDNYSASVASQGALVFIDSAYNIPNHDSPARIVNPSTEVLIALSPERTYAARDIKSFTPAQRQCYYSDENQSVLNVFFNDLVSTRNRRDVHLNWQNVLAAYGGLLSLMLGFTLISGIDLLLFLAVRVFYEPFSRHFTKVSPGIIKVKEYNKRVNAWVDKASPCEGTSTKQTTGAVLKTK
ncbi:Pickpocket 16 [Operophtera brumata]|uniref:Pickpocket 16 n=1 Tax=Operophtera brumata TaxID=104452 RepID=A0A0L7LJ81_OPEBR|nr:Pickpocket 16 [Operophtera brumata]